MTWNQAAPIVGMQAFPDEEEEEDSPEEEPEDSAAAQDETQGGTKQDTEAQQRHREYRAQFAALLEAHHQPGSGPAQHRTAKQPPAPASTTAVEPGDAASPTRSSRLQQPTAIQQRAGSNKQQQQPAHDGQPDTQASSTASSSNGGSRDMPLDSAVSWTQGGKQIHWLLRGGYLQPRQLPPELPLSRYSHAHFQYMGRGGWAGVVLSRTSSATPSYNTVKLHGFGRVRQSADTHVGEVVSIGVELELHPINGDTVWHLFIRSSAGQREPNSLPLQPGHYRMTWLPQTNNWRIEAMDPDDGELLHRARHDHQGRPQQLSAHLQEHELQQLQRGEQAETAIRGARRLAQKPRAYSATALQQSQQPGKHP